ncbi:MAG: TolB family protein [Aggregatilineales bacterium]
MASGNERRAPLNGKRLWQIAAISAIAGMALTAAWWPGVHTAHADKTLPDALCALISGQVVCYDANTALPKPITPADPPAIDFAIAPDGQWLAYRAGQTLSIAPIADGQVAVHMIDPQAIPSAGLSRDQQPEAVTLAWAPDGLAIAYLTAFGLRVTDPSGQFANADDKPYMSLMWSPDGNRLAAQATDSSWTFFACTHNPLKLSVTRIFADAASMAWLDEKAVIVAPTAGGLLRIDPTSANAAPAWYVADEHFIKLNQGQPEQVVALHLDAGDHNGIAVAIDADGHWTPFGGAKLDPRLSWGPAPADQLAYITSGTPIMVDRATGDENMLPLQRVDALAWSPGTLPEVQGLAMDADLYFIAPDSTGIEQLWRLPRDGFPLIQLSHSTVPVTAYEVGADAIRFTAGSVSILVHPDGSSLTPTPTATIVLSGSALRTATALAKGVTATPAQPTQTPTPFLTVTPRPAVGQVTIVGWQPGPSVVQRALATGTPSRTYLLERALLSPGGGYAAGYRGAQLVILNWDTAREVAIQGIQNPIALKWIG